MHITLQCMPFCMKVAQRLLAQSEFIVQVAPKMAPMPVPVLLVALVVPLLDEVAVALDVAPAPPPPPWPPPPVVALVVVAAAPPVPLALVPPPAPVLVLPVVSPPHPAVRSPIPIIPIIQRIRSSASFGRTGIVRGTTRVAMLHRRELEACTARCSGNLRRKRLSTSDDARGDPL
jgi:hypothetical protein